MWVYLKKCKTSIYNLEFRENRMMFRLVILLSVLLSTVYTDFSAPIDIENIDSSELSEANLRRAASELSLTASSSQFDTVSSSENDFSLDLLSPQRKHSSTGGVPGQGRCESITVPMCQNLAYNLTSMPNQFEHTSQSEAAAEAHQFWALVEINCSSDLKFFLCSMYTPICIPEYNKPVKACRSVCVRARLGCERYMKKFGFDWPDHMNCDLFPEHGEAAGAVCMDPVDAQEAKKTNKDTKKSNHNIIKQTKQHRLKPSFVTGGMNQADLIKFDLFGQM